jgi:hypothetical protein
MTDFSRLGPEGEELAGFLGFFLGRYSDGAGRLPEELHPLQIVRRVAETAPKRALAGLRMAVGDCIERSSHWRPEQVKEADDAARAQGVATLSEIRRRYWRRVAGIVKRGRIRTEAEYYLARSLVTDAHPTADEAARLQALLEEFESRVGK